jgi:hypothetical protein
MVEVRRNSEDDWRQAGPIINPGDPYGSISDNTKNGRDVYYFGVDLIEGTAVVKRSEAGIDVDLGGSRRISSIGGVLVASLNPGEHYEMTIKTDRSPSPLSVKFTHLNQ